MCFFFFKGMQYFTHSLKNHFPEIHQSRKTSQLKDFSSLIGRNCIGVVEVKVKQGQSSSKGGTARVYLWDLLYLKLILMHDIVQSAPLPFPALLQLVKHCLSISLELVFWPASPVRGSQLVICRGL